MKSLLKILDRFIDYLKLRPNSLIAKIFGMYTIISKAFLPVHLILMENTVRLNHPKSKRISFDLKGSTINREVKLNDNQWKLIKNDHQFVGELKEINFLRIQQNLGRSLVYLDDETCR